MSDHNTTYTVPIPTEMENNTHTTMLYISMEDSNWVMTSDFIIFTVNRLMGLIMLAQMISI